MFEFLNLLLPGFVLFHTFEISFAITNESDESVREFRYCLRRSGQFGIKECVGRSAISFLQSFDERDNFTVADSLIVTRDDTAASRSLVNFLDTDPVDFRGILENAGAVISQRSLEFHMDAIYPGLMFKIGPSADSNSVAQFMLDPTVDERHFNYEEPSTARILAKQYILPFLLGLKFNLVALVPILFTVICLLLKKSLFIAKLVVYISSILGVGGVAGALGGAFGGWKDFFRYGHGHGVGGIPPHPHDHIYNGGQIAGGLGVYPGKNSVYHQYDEDELQYTSNSPYNRQDRKIVFKNTRENSGSLSGVKSNVRSTVEPFLTVTRATDHFYEYDKQALMQDRSAYGDDTNEEVAEVAGVVNISPSHQFKTSDNSGWKVVNLRV